MSFDANEIAEFKAEALELLEEAEQALLEVERGQAFKERYDAAFRCFHSLKGAAGMLELETLRHHMHHVEDLFATFKDKANLSAANCTYFLNAIDAAKSLIDGNEINFSYNLPESEHAATVKKPEQRYDVFILDDEEDLVEILGAYMDKNKLSWKGFTNPLDAVALFKTNLPKLIISDIRMPQLDGMQVLSQLREVSKDTPLIFISGHLNKELVIDAMARGVSGLIEKPFREPHVIAQVLQALQRAELTILLNRTIEILMFQMPDLEQFLIQNNRHNILNTLKSDVTQVLAKRRELKQPKK